MKYTTDPGGIGHFESLGGPLNFFLGSIDKFAMWNRVLSASEVNQLFAKYLDVHPVVDKQSNVGISPNPASDVVSITTNPSFYGINYELTDLTGKIIYEGVIDSNVENIDIGDLYSGLYILRIGNTSYKVLKN